MSGTATHILNLIALLFIAVFANVRTSSGQIHRWNTESGLSNDWVSQIAQDDDGYMWIATQNGFNRFDGYSFTTYHYEPGNTQSLSANWVRALDMDQQGGFWLSIFLGGINSFNPREGVAKRFVVFKDSVEVLDFRTVYCDEIGSVWIGGRHGLFKKDQKSDHFHLVEDYHVMQIEGGENGTLFILTPNQILQYNIENKTHEIILEFENGSINKIFFDKAQVLWVLSKIQLFSFTSINGKWYKKNWQLDNVINGGYFFNTPIFEDGKGNLKIGSKLGITSINAERTNVSTKSYESMFSDGNSIEKCLAFLEDKHENIWIGTSNGLLLASPFSDRFYDQNVYPHIDDISYPRDMLQIDDELWYANQDGLFHVNIKEKEAKIHRVLYESIYAIHYSSKKRLYAGTLAGLVEVDLGNFSSALIKKRGNNQDEINGGVLWAIEEDKKGHLWIGSVGALQRLDVETKQLIHLSPKNTIGLKSSPSQDILIDQQGRLWAASLKSGLYMLPNPGEITAPEQAKFKRFAYDAKDRNSLCSNITLFLAQGQDGSIWVATDGGLNHLIDDGKTIKRYTRNNGLIDDKIMGLVADTRGDIWGSTIGHGIFRLNPKNDHITFFNRKDGLVSNNFLLSSAFYNNEGMVLFGSDNKLQIIDPTRVERIKKPVVQCYFTKLTFADEKNSSLAHQISINQKSSVDLPANRRSFHVQFAPLNYYRTEKTTYEFLLDGLHTTWQSNGHQREFSFTGLTPGNYILRVRPSHADILFDQEEYVLKINISKPWWSTWWAYLLYILTVLLLAYRFYLFQLNRRLEKSESRRLQEMDAMKNRLYTNLTHELRTPLTIILGMANNLANVATAEVKDKAMMIRRNGQNLLDVVNQILELSKVESGAVHPEWVHGDLIVYMRYIVESFESFARSHNIELHYLPEPDQLQMDYDAEKIQKIASNLISNAIKNTNNGGNIYLQIRKQESTVELHVRDTGKGISKDHLPYIFDRFYQTKAKQGSTGIGLSLTKELIVLQGGTIRVESEFGHGSTFIVSLPIHNRNGIPKAGNIEKSERILTNQFEKLPSSNELFDETVPLILLIEDNDDVLYFLAEILKTKYRLVFAKNGKSGIEVAFENIPDIVISDVMMPVKDGFEVCAELKSNDKTSHIPIILLTAKADTESRIEGLESGADAYLPKPFHEEELDVRIRKLLELRQNLQRRYQKDEYWDNQKLEHETIEDDFVKKVRAIIEANLTDSNFGIAELCTEMAISRVHLHRKLKALTDQSTSHFIRRIRLQKAKILLVETKLNISEIAYDVGFSDPAYFSRVYTEVFGNPPSAQR